MYDTIIIGKGPAGISASLYTVRANFKTLVIGGDDSALRKAKHIENYFGFEKAQTGEELLSAGVRQATMLGVELVEDEVIAIEKKDRVFDVTTSNGEYLCRALLIATGQHQKKVDIENLQRFEGKGVSYCSTCDGYFYNNLKVGVLGFEDYALHEAIELEMYTKDITIFTNGKELEITQKAENDLKSRFKVNKKSIQGLGGENFLKTIYFKDGSSEEIDGLFVAYGRATSVDFAKKLGILLRDNSIVVDIHQHTNVSGVFAAGDCTEGLKQVSAAVGQGAVAGKSIIEYLRDIKK